MRTLNVSLTDTLDTYVQQKLENGSYASASEVVREAIRTMQERDRKDEELRAAVRRGIASGKGRRLREISVASIAKTARRRRAPR